MTFCHTWGMDKPLEHLAALARERDELPARIADAITQARAAGANWEQIGQVLGTSRTGAMKTYARYKETNR